jgi:hypothetical protein
MPFMKLGWRLLVLAGLFVQLVLVAPLAMSMQADPLAICTAAGKATSHSTDAPGPLHDHVDCVLCQAASAAILSPVMAQPGAPSVVRLAARRDAPAAPAPPAFPPAYASRAPPAV